MPPVLYQEMEKQMRCFWTCSTVVFLLVADSHRDLKRAGMKIPAAGTGLERASRQQLIKESLCLLRPHFSPPCT